MTRILVDMDDVIADINDYWISEVNRISGMSYTTEDIIDFDMTICFPDINKETIYSIIDEPGFFYRAPVIKDSQEILKEMWDKYDCRICSAASYSNYAVKEKWLWLQKHFPFIEKEKVIFTKDKSIVDADFLIDDAIHNIEPFIKVNKFRVGLLYNRPKNNNFDLKQCERVKSWEEIGDYFGV